MDAKEILTRLRAYNRTRNSLLCTGLEKQYMKHIDEHNFMYTYGVHDADLPEDVETFLAQQKQFRGLLGEHHEKLCRYLQHIQEYTCNKEIVRMDIRSRKFYRSKQNVLRAIGAFYWFYGAELSMKDLVYGEYRDLIYNSDFSQVIASELLADNPEVIQYCRDVLTSENNTAVLTRDVIVAVEQSHNQELQQLLLQVFLTAKLQEGLRQSIVETADENTFPFFEMVMDAIEKENLLRFSSVQRAVLTWIGIGYQEVKEKDVRYIFEHIRSYMERLPKITEHLKITNHLSDGELVGGGNFLSSMEISDNPLDVYIALYCIGVSDVEKAIEEACRLLQDSRRYVVASALVYLRLSRSFEAARNLYFPERFKDDEWILALFYAECARLWKDIQKLDMTEQEGRKLYGQMEAFLPVIKSKKTYSSKGFEWFVLGISKSDLCHSMFFLLDRFPSADLAERYLPYVSSVLNKKELDLFMEKYFPLIPEESQKSFMVKEIISSNSDLRKWIVKKYTGASSNSVGMDGRPPIKMTLTEAELIELEERLKTKKANARADIVEVLAAQDQAAVRASYERLIESPVKTIRESALELKKKTAQYFPKETENTGDKPESRGVVSAELETDILHGMEFGSVEIQGKEKGFGLYKPMHVYELECPDYLQAVKKGLLKKSVYVDLKSVFPLDRQQVLEYIRKWSVRITQHEKDEYYTGHEYRQVGERAFYPLNYQVHGLDALPLAEIWKAYFLEDKLKEEEVFEIHFLLASVRDNINLEKMLNVQSEFFTLEQKEIQDIPYFTHFSTIFGKYFQEMEQTVDFSAAARRLLQLLIRHTKSLTYRLERYQTVETCALTANHSVYFLESQLKLRHAEDEEFRRDFPVIWEMYNRFNLGTPSDVQSKPVVVPAILARAVYLGMLPVEALYEGILDIHMDAANRYSYSRVGGQLSDAFRDAYYEGKGVWGKPHFALEQYHPVYHDFGREVYTCLRNALDQVTDTLLAMECQRLNEKTEVTDYVRQLLVIRGVKYLLMALRMLEGENISRQTYGEDRDVVFSNVIRHCYPNEVCRVDETGVQVPDDIGLTSGKAVPAPDGSGLTSVKAAPTSDEFYKGKSDAEILAAAGIKEERLVEIAMLAPQWIDTVNEVLKWDGFREACYYFTAHMKQYDFKQKKAEIAKYTELEPEDLNDGAFDMEWCRSVYALLGEKRFQMLYKASKFLCENAFHTRARKYADACLGRKGKEEWKREAVEKRNKDALNAYCICPLVDDADLLERYLYVQQFLKESRKYGAQRQASEKRAVEMALMNLARNSRFETVTRLSWMMESEGIRQNAEVLEPKILSGSQKKDSAVDAGANVPETKKASGQKQDCIEVWIEIDTQGRNEICIRKNGKKQKSIPVALKKDAWILHLKEIHSQWNEQYKRSRRMLEQAMEERTEFTREELDVMMKNPIVAPMLEKLVLICGEETGFYRNGKLEIGSTGRIRIAHPYDLYQGQCWNRYQRYLFETGMIQPFKQVFRELYLKLEEESDKSESRRYSGYQIQTKKAAAALKSRKWNVSYESGLERIYYKENLVVNLFAEADWFSPSDIEAPSIEYVAFYSRKEGTPVLIRDIDPVIFSETMRDLDLAVSTAYVGGVDPITSFSTIELRRTIVEYTCQLMKLENVTVQEHFANIKGCLNEYSVHLGSGVIHQSGGAAIHIIAVHSGKRGKVYLPFLDEDPKTAEIISKVVMLAEDGKIKDPEVLRQIRK